MLKNHAIGLSFLIIAPWVSASQLTSEQRSVAPNITEKRIELGSGAPQFKHEKNIMHPQLTLSNLSSKQLAADREKLTINAPESTGQVWLSGFANTLAARQTVKTEFVNDAFFNRLAVSLDMYVSSHETAVGFLAEHRQTQHLVNTHVRRFPGTNGPRYVLNFDGGDLVYFDLDNTLIPSYRPSNQGSSNSIPLFANEGKVLLSNSIKNSIIASAVNRMGIPEANHISIKDNEIILDTKEMLVNNLPEKKSYFKQTVNTIEGRNNNRVTDNLLNIEWKPRKRIAGIRY